MNVNRSEIQGLICGASVLRGSEVTVGGKPSTGDFLESKWKNAFFSGVESDEYYQILLIGFIIRELKTDQ